MKKLILIALIFCVQNTFSQSYNNEWIDYSKSYYKFRTNHVGLTRIPYTVLNAAGLAATPAEQFQVWHNGKQVPIYTTKQAGAFGTADYIEFWGIRNDGKADSALYRAGYQLNDAYSLEEDSSTYFLAVNPVTANNLRFTPTANNIAGNTKAPVPFFMHKLEQNFTGQIYDGKPVFFSGFRTYASEFDKNEGIASLNIQGKQSVAYAENTLQVYTGAGTVNPYMTLLACGNSQDKKPFTVKVNGTAIGTGNIDSFNTIKATYNFNLSSITGNTTNFSITNDNISSVEYIVFSKAQLYYPRNFNFQGYTNFTFELPASPTGDYLEIANFLYNPDPKPALYDITNNRRYEMDITTPSLIKVVLQPSATPRTLILVNSDPGNAIPITKLTKRDFINYRTLSNQGDYVIISHPTLAAGATNPINDYKTYRTSAAGGGFNAKVFLMDDLTDQFAFGIKGHPLSVRNFLNFAKNNFTTSPKYAFLIGKGVDYKNASGHQYEATFDKLNLIPTYGFPASDNLLGALPGAKLSSIPLGRLSAVNQQEVSDYLAKVKEYELTNNVESPLIADKLWQKEVVHVVGAGTTGEESQFGDILKLYGKIVVDSLYGANLTTFVKTSADAVQAITSTQLTQRINDGIGLLTYFGHSSANTLSFNLDNPEAYANRGKYPTFIVLGCNAGDLFQYVPARTDIRESISEKYVLAKQLGAIAFYASTTLGIVGILDEYATEFYRSFSLTNYGGALGEHTINAGAVLVNKPVGIDPTIALHRQNIAAQMTLHGDPFIKLRRSPKPDYVIEDPLVITSPSFVSIADAGFNVSAKFYNLGRALNRKMVVEVKRTYPDNTVQIFKRDTVAATFFTDSLGYFIPIVAGRDNGLNKITVTLDALNAVDEVYETNNSVTKEIFIYENDIKPVFPYNYSIVNKQGIKLAASIANPFASSRAYTMELDTTELYNSPLKVTKSVTSVGGLLEFDPAITFTDSSVYYWRVAPVVATGTPNWNQYSFQFINNGFNGFSQAHYYQHKKSTFTNINYGADRIMNFKPKENTLFVRNGVWAGVAVIEADVSVSVNEDPFIRMPCHENVDSVLIFNVFDASTFKPWVNRISGVTGLYSSLYPDCPDSARMYNFEFNNNYTGRLRARNFLRNIPDGSFVVLRNFISKYYGGSQFVNKWKEDDILNGAGNSLYGDLKTQGFNLIDSFTAIKSFAFSFKKNAQAIQAPKSVISTGLYDAITLNALCYTVDTAGQILSPAFGKAKAWKQLKWRGRSLDAVATNDKPFVDIIGINAAGVQTVLFSNISVNQQDFDISSISAIQYPYLRLRMKNRDTATYTPYQLRYWMLTYDPIPEGAIAPNILYNGKDTVTAGEPLTLGVAFKNVSNVAFADSIVARVTLTNQNNIAVNIPVSRAKALQPGDTTVVNVSVDSKNYPGVNRIDFYYNPDYVQPEMSTLNNFGGRTFYVSPDVINPMMDVTFDGLHILNGDIISAKPQIVVKLKDEAKYLLLNDTSLVKVRVQFPDGTWREYKYGSDTLKFIPASSSADNTASVVLAPYFPDGTYVLTVTGKDRSGNAAGNIEYRITFEVINKPQISNMLNYPNPFTTSTAFVFTLTGAEVPQNMRIQILTVTGKIVREITKNELGPLHIGRNITEYKWDGTDQYGQKLANGVYLYRVLTNLNGKELDKYTTISEQNAGVDKYFNKGYGKMYLMR